MKKIFNLKDKFFTCLAVLALLIIWYVFKLPCIFLWAFKIPCLGCGITRAYQAVLRLDFATAFSMNFMFWAVPIFILYYLFDGEPFKQKWLNIGVFALITLGFVVNWILKL
jgi:hypothetical protein